MDPVYGYQGMKVEAQLNNSSSLLHRTRQMIEVRKQHRAFGCGQYAELGASNPTVFAFLRTAGSEVVVCVNNLSRFPQPVELDLARYAGLVPVELTGGVRFPTIGEPRYQLTLPGHGFYWFQLLSDNESGVTA